MIYARITGTGGYLPDKVLTNHDLERIVDTTDQWIRERTGISKRHVARDGQNTVDLAEPAARRALELAAAGGHNLLMIGPPGTGKTFVLQHWEGDWAIRGNYKPEETPTPQAIEGMAAWLNARQDGVDAARKAVEAKNVHVYHAGTQLIEEELVTSGELLRQAERLRDHRRVQHLLFGDLLLQVRFRILGAVGVAFGRDVGHGILDVFHGYPPLGTVGRGQLGEHARCRHVGSHHLGGGPGRICV